jgi:hypothetical protein
MDGAGGAALAEVRKHFFFEKKKQKTFGPWRALQESKVFWFFFSKKNILPFYVSAYGFVVPRP